MKIYVIKPHFARSRELKRDSHLTPRLKRQIRRKDGERLAPLTVGKLHLLRRHARDALIGRLPFTFAFDH